MTLVINQSIIHKNYGLFSSTQKYNTCKTLIFLSFAKNMGKKNGKNVSENAGSKYSQKLLVHAKQSATYTPKTASKRAIQKTAEPIGDLVSNEIADRIRKVSKTSQQSTLEIVTNEHDKEVSKQRYIYLQKKNRKLLII